MKETKVKFNAFAGITVASWLLVLLVVAAEKIPEFKSALASVFSHHWIAKGVLIALAFVVFGFWLANARTIAGKPAGRMAWWSVLASLALILVFYSIEFVLK